MTIDRSSQDPSISTLKKKHQGYPLKCSSVSDVRFVIAVFPRDCTQYRFGSAWDISI